MLAVATFASVRSANKAARVAEHALLVGLRPLLLPSGNDDEVQKVRFGDGRYVRLNGGRSVAEVDGDAAFLAISLRNAGTGIGVIHGWRYLQDMRASAPPHPDSSRAQTRDLYVSPGVSDSGRVRSATRAIRSTPPCTAPSSPESSSASICSTGTATPASDRSVASSSSVPPERRSG